MSEGISKAKLRCAKCGYIFTIWHLKTIDSKKLACPKCGAKNFYVEEPMTLE
ncbi:MAG: FmdB family zinc ribbon protein [Candidatus Baldrarchaeia archaeon]